MPNDSRNDGTGRFARKYPDEAFFEAIATLEIAGTADVAREVGCDHDTAYKRLHEFEDSGFVARRRRAGALLWTLTEEVEA